jgi:serine/threonine protein kinase
VQLYSVTTSTFNVQLYLRRHEMSLHDFLQQLPTEAQAKVVAQSVLRGLAHLHGKGYVHRDLKPGNILVDSRPLAAVISDLGSAHFGVIEAGRRALTTITSRAPEILMAQSYGQKSDIWSLGCTLAEVEQRLFFRKPLVVYSDPRHLGNGRDIQFMNTLVKILLPHDATAECYRLDKRLLFKGAVAPGVVGMRFKDGFHPFMEKLLHFQPQARATALELLDDPWLNSLGA